MKNNISEEIQRAICRKNNYEDSKRLLDACYYDQFGHIDIRKRNTVLKREFPIYVKQKETHVQVYVRKNNILKLQGTYAGKTMHTRYHSISELENELKRGC